MLDFPTMKSVADDLRRAQRDEVLALSPDERIALSFRLGDEDLEQFQQASGLSRDEARKANIPAGWIR